MPGNFGFLLKHPWPKNQAVSRTDGNSSSSPSICGMEEFVISHMFIRYIAIADLQSIYVFQTLGIFFLAACMSFMMFQYIRTIWYVFGFIRENMALF